jgi:putative tricarboxylic transport membrane protein
LMQGIDVAVLAMGLFGIGEIFYLSESTATRSLRETVKVPRRFMELLPDREDWKTSIKPIGRGSILGFFIGIIPGAGPLIAGFSSYAIEKKFSRNPGGFGKGAIEGVAGPANNSAASGGFIPLLTLGIPSNVVMALLLGAFMIHGVTPGPFIIKEHSQIFWAVVTSMYIGNIFLLILNVPLIKIFVKIVEVPMAILSPLIILVCVVGAYSINNNPVDVLIMIIFGGVGYFLRKFDYDPAPLALAFVLCPILEKSFRQSLVASQGSLSIFLHRPISMVLLALAFFIIGSGLVAAFRKSRRPIAAIEQAGKPAGKEG